MGQKVNPIGIRLGITRNWESTWYADHASYSQRLNQDLSARRFLRKELEQAMVSRIQIDRPKDAIITIHTARPGIIIGKKGGGVESLRNKVSKILGTPTRIT